VVTETDFLLLDAHFDEIPPGLHAAVKQLPGVLETGLFEGYESEIVD
jgi:ribose 5-phosphate isomerase